jgi:glycosyltransferase involved in cell wall biosynthesis
MRIGFDAKRAFHNYSGLGNYSRFTISNICRLYPENNYYLYTPRIKDDKLFIKPANSSIVKPGKGPWRRSGSLWRTFRLTHRLNRDAIDLYHGLSNELPYGIHHSSVRTVITIHDLIFMEHPEMYGSLNSKIYEQKVRYGARAATRIIAVSEQTKQDIIRFLGVDESRIRVVYQGCHHQFYRRVSKETMHFRKQQFNLPDEYLLYVGTIEERKNLLSIVQALYQAKIDFPLVVVGRKTSYFNRVKQFIEHNRMENIFFLDHVRNTDLPAIYQGSAGFIYPSLYEGFGIPILEALNSGIPVITTRGGCLEETAGKGALLIDPYDPGALAYAIRQVLEQPEIRRKLIRGGRAHALKYREDRTIPSLYNVYLECNNI